MADKNLSLGTIFTAKVDAGFKKATQDLLTITERLTQSMNKLNNSMKGVTLASTQYKRKIDDAVTATGRLGGKADFAGKQIAKVRGAYERFTAALKVTAAYGVAATMIYKLVEGIGAGIQEIIDFDQALKNLQAITNATSTEVDSMGEAVKDVARVTKFSTGEVAAGMVLLAQAGFSAAEATQAIGATANLATGTLSNMALTSDLLTTTIRAFNLEAIEANRVADVMANAINRSKLTIDKLRIAFNFVGAAAAQTGLSLEETSASMMVLANNGLRASTIGTGLRQVLSRLLAPNRKLREAFEAHGIALDDVNPSIVGFQKALKNLAPLIFDNKKGVVDMGKAYTLFGLRGAQAAAVLVKGFLTGDYTSMLDKVYEFGSSARMAEKQAEGLGVKLKNLADKAKLVAIALGEAGVTEALRILLTVLQNVTSAIESFIKTSFGKFVVQIILLVGSLTILTKILGVVFVHFGKLIAVTKIILTFFNPLVAVLAGVTAGFIYLYQSANKTTRELEKSASKVSQNVSSLELYGKTLQDLWERHSEENDMSRQYLNTLQHLIKAYPELEGKIKLTILAHKENAKAIEETLGKEVQKQIDENVKLISQYADEAKRAAFWAGMWAKSIEFVKNKLKSMKEDWKEVISDPVSEFFKREWELLRKELDSVLPEGWWDRIKKGFTESFDQAGKAVKTFKINMTELGLATKEATGETEKALDAWNKVGEGLYKQGKGYDFIALKMQSLGASSEAIARTMETIRKLAKTQEEIDTGTKGSTDALKKAALDLERRYLSLLLIMETDVRTKIQDNYNKRLADIEKYYNDKVNLLKKSISKEEAERRAGIDRSKLESAARKEKDQKILDFETKLSQDKLKLEEVTQKRLNEIRVRGAISDKASMKRVKEEILASDIELQKKRVDLAEKEFVKISDQYNEENDKYIQSKFKLAQEMAKLEEMITEDEIRQAKLRTEERKKELKYLLDYTKRFGEDYVHLLDEAYELDMLSHEEYMNRWTAATLSAWENFKYGVEEARKSAQTITEMMQEMGRKIVDTISTDLTGAFWDFADGTKTAAEAFKDFAKSTIRWIGEMITRQLIFNAIMGAMGPSSSGANTTTTRGGQGGGYGFHEGGIVGVTPAPVRIVNPNIFANAKRLHGGLRNDEFPAILQKGEEVIPKGGSRDITVNLTNKTDVEMAKPKVTQRRDGSQLILDVVLDAANRNKGGFRDNMKGMMK